MPQTLVRGAVVRDREREDWNEIDFEGEPTLPKTVIAAGVIWIVFGSLILINLVAYLVQVYGQDRGGPREAVFVGGTIGGIIIGLVAAVFIHVGVQSVRGTANDTLGNGVGSIGFALFDFFAGVMQIRGGHNLQAGVSFLAGFGLLLAGVLALVGRREYRAWRKLQ